MQPLLPSTICFRVTRYCNARCGFCLAPPDGTHPPVDELTSRIDWLMARGVKTIHFCGGEPTIHPGLPVLLRHVCAKGGSARLTTNGIAMSDAVMSALHDTRTRVKLSLHGNREHHDVMVGRTAAFDLATAHLRQLLSKGVHTSVQTTIIGDALWVVDWMADFCLDVGVHQWSILPFIPRGHGELRQDEYGLSTAQRNELREAVKKKRHQLSGRLDVRWLDFSAQALHVVESDGRVVLEGASEGLDKVLCEIPATIAWTRKRSPKEPELHLPSINANSRFEKPYSTYSTMPVSTLLRK